MARTPDDLAFAAGVAASAAVHRIKVPCHHRKALREIAIVSEMAATPAAPIVWGGSPSMTPG
jgi:hypothetical protein